MVDSSTGATRRSIVDPQMATAWRAGRLEFAGDSLATVIASVNRYSVRPIVLEDPALAQLTFTGTVFVDAIDASLDAMQQISLCVCSARRMETSGATSKRSRKTFSGSHVGARRVPNVSAV